MAVTKELKEAIIKMQAKDEAAFATFYEQTYSYVYAKAKYMMRNEEDALDLTQETYIQAYRGIGSIRDINSVYAWLGGIVNRQGMKIFDKKKDVLTSEDQDYIFEEMEAEDATPEQTVDKQATADIVKGMIDELPELQRVAVMAFYYDNMKIDDIASFCECSANTIKSRLNYAKKFLKEKVEAHEKQNRYKLCSLSPAILLLAFRSLFAEAKYQMSAEVSKSVYMASCNSLGIQAVATLSSGATIGGGVSASTGATTVGATAGGNASASAGATADGVAAAAKTGIAVKLGIAAAALIAAGGIGIAVVKNTNNTTPKEPVAAVQDKDVQTSEDKAEEEKAESIYNEAIPMEGLYGQGMYTISITNATVDDIKNATFDMELIYTNPETGEKEVVTATSVRKENNIAAVDATSDLGNRWFGNLMFLYDNSIRLDLSEQDTTGSTWDIGWDSSVAILTKAAANGTIQNRMPEAGTYSFTEGANAANDGGYVLTISNVYADSFEMSFEIISDGGHKVDILETDFDWVFMRNGIATFTGTTGWNVGLHGYLYVNDDGSISLSYTAMLGADEVPWYGAYPDGTFEPIVLTKN